MQPAPWKLVVGDPRHRFAPLVPAIRGMGCQKITLADSEFKLEFNSDKEREQIHLAGKQLDGAGGGGRTHTPNEGHEILSLARLPVPPLRPQQ